MFLFSFMLFFACNNLIQGISNLHQHQIRVGNITNSTTEDSKHV